MRRGAALLLLLLGGCGPGAGTEQAAGPRTVAVTVSGPGGRHVFRAEIAGTAAEQARGLMYRIDMKPDDGMLFTPYPAAGGPPKVATFWMKNTPAPLDILFIRPDGTVARIAENTIPYSEDMVSSGEPVSAVLELPGGRVAETGVSEGDRVSWPGK